MTDEPVPAYPTEDELIDEMLDISGDLEVLVEVLQLQVEAISNEDYKELQALEAEKRELLPSLFRVMALVKTLAAMKITAEEIEELGLMDSLLLIGRLRDAAAEFERSVVTASHVKRFVIRSFLKAVRDVKSSSLHYSRYGNMVSGDQPSFLKIDDDSAGGSGAPPPKTDDKV